MPDDAFATKDGGEPWAFPVRAVLSLGWPPAWASAASVGLGSVVLALLLVAGTVHGAHGAWLGFDLHRALTGMGALYDAAADPVVVERGVVRVEGTRLPRSEQGDQVVLVDPEGTVPLETITSPEFIVVHRDEIVRKRPPFGRIETLPIAPLQAMVGVDPLVVDGAHLDAFARGWGVAMSLGVAAIITVIATAVDVILCVAYGALAGFVIGPVVPSLPYAARAKVAIATATATILPSFLLRRLGVPVPGCVGIVLWPLLIAVGAGLAARTRGGHS